MKWNFLRKNKQSAYPDIPTPAPDPATENKEQIHNSKFEQLGLYELVKTLPWEANDIYLQDKKKHIKAVCSNADIAKALANCVDHYSRLPGQDISKMTLYKDFLQDAYYLYIAMSKAKIPVTNIETAFVEKAFHQFCQSFGKLLEKEHIRLDTVEENQE